MPRDLSNGAVDRFGRVVDLALLRANDWHTRLAKHLELPRSRLMLATGDDQDRSGSAWDLRVSMLASSQRERAGQLAGKPGRAAEQAQPAAAHRAGERHQVVVRLRVGDHDPLLVVMQETPERVWLTAKRGQIEEANGRPMASPKQGNQVRNEAGATDSARFQRNTVDVLAAADRRSPLGGK